MTQPKFFNGIVDGRDLYLLYRDAAGVRMARRVPAEWCSFLRKSDALAPREIVADPATGRIVQTDVYRMLRDSKFVVGIRDEGEFLRVSWLGDEWRRKAHGREGFFHELGIDAYEADVDPVRRYFSDTGAPVGLPRRVYLDIETDSRVPPAVARQGKARVLCWSLAVDGENDGPPRTLAAAVLGEDTDAAERQLLEALFVAIEPFDQVCAWFGDLFDFPVVKLRAQRVEARIKDPRRWLWMDHAEVYDRMNKNAAESGDEKSSMALEFVAQEVLGEGKDDFDARKTWEAWVAGGAERERMVAYCCKDTLLLAKIEEKTGYLALNASVCEVCRVFADTDSATPSKFVDGYMLRMGVERGMRFPSRPWTDPNEERKKFAGAWVLEPQGSGIRKNVHVVDFSGMYPSIIQSLNISPEMVANDVPVSGPIPPNRCRAPTTRVAFRTDVVGMLPTAVADMKGLRKFWTKRQAELPPGSPEWWEAARRSAAYKVVVNIFYGIAGSPFSRYSDIRCAESVSTTGVWLIQKTIAAAEQAGMKAIYSDTDSAFFMSATGEELTYAKVEAFVAWCNRELYPTAMKELGCKDNFTELAYEKIFERLVLVSKKNYAAVYASYKGTATCSCDVARKGKLEPGPVDVKTMTCRACGKVWTTPPPPRGKPEIRGLEYRRGDSNRIARRLQKAIVDLLMTARCEDPRAFVPLIESAKKHVLEGTLPVDDVSNAQALSQTLKAYDKAKAKLAPKKDGTEREDAAHVKVAKTLRDRGEQMVEGVKVAYVVVDGAASPMKVIPAVDYAGECDRYYLWEKRVYPAAQRVLEAAFPAEPGMSTELLVLRDWVRFLKARPRKKRGQNDAWEAAAPGRNPGSVQPRKAAEAQRDLFASAPPVVASSAPAPSGPYVIELADRTATRLAIRAVLAAHPGSRPVEARARGVDGNVVVTDFGGIRVAVSPELERAIERAKAS